MSTRLEITIEPQGPTLKRYYESNAPVSLIRGPLGSGKTVTSCMRIMRHMMEQWADSDGVRRSRWYAIRNTYSDLFSTTVKDWMELFRELGDFKQGSREPPTHRMRFRLEDGSNVEAEMIFLALDRPEHTKKLRGSQVTGVWLNEVKELSKAVVDMADLRHGRYPRNCRWHGMIGDYNAPDEDHWLYRLAEEQKPDGWEFLVQPGGVIAAGTDSAGRVRWIENPDAENLANLPEGYYRRGMAGKDDAWIKVNLANEYGFVLDGRPVYPTYSDAIHCREFEIHGSAGWFLRGWDYGLTPACVLAHVTPQGQLRFFDEVVADRAGISLFTDEVLMRCARHYPGLRWEDEGDPAGSQAAQTDERTCFEIQAGKGVEVNPGPVSLEARLESVRYGLNTMIDGQPAILIHPRCRMLRKGFMGGYQYRRLQISGDRYTDKPDKNQYSHPHDAAQYVAARVFGEIIAGGQTPEDEARDLPAFAEDLEDPLHDDPRLVISARPRVAADDWSL